MRLLHHDARAGLWRLRIETPSDLWRVSRLVRPGDTVGASTTRRDPEAPAETPAAQRARRRVWLTVRVEQVEFHGFSRHVRFTGPILAGPFDLGRHHTLDLAEGDELVVGKPELTGADRTLLDEGVAGGDEPTLLVATVDWGESTIVRIRGRAIEPLADLDRAITGKRYGTGSREKDRAAYLEEIVELLTAAGGAAEAIVIAGPGFLKETVAKAIAAASRELSRKVRVVPTNASGRAGLDELLRSGRASEALRGAVAAEEADLVERLVTALGGGRRAAIGPVEVRAAIEAGAVETLLVGESLLSDDSVRPSIETARRDHARVLVVRDDGPGGRRLTGLGGIGALLRYDWLPPGRTEPATGSPGSPRADPRSGA